MSLQFTRVRSLNCRGRLWNLQADCSSASLRCVTITWQQIFKVGLWSRKTNFRLRLWIQLQTTKVFGIGYKMIWSIENWNSLHYLHNSLTPQTWAAEPEPKFQAPAPPTKRFSLWFRLQSPKNAWAPAPKSCFKSSLQVMVEGFLPHLTDERSHAD